MAPTDVVKDVPVVAQSVLPERRGTMARFGGKAPVLAWTVASVLLFAALWELGWAVGLLDARLLPPPHIFLRHIGEQAQFFTSQNSGEASQSGAVGVLLTVVGSFLRVLIGLGLAFVISLATGVFVSYFGLARKLVLPTLTMLAPISVVAWLPVAIFIFGIGNGPAIFMVFIGLFFIMTLATVSQIESVSVTYLNVAKTMGASRAQTFRRVILPAIVPGLFVVLRLNLFAAWTVVLIAEAVGVGSGLGQVILVARNTFNPPLVFFTMTLIGIAGYLSDVLLRMVQGRLLWWQGSPSGSLGGQ